MFEPKPFCFALAVGFAVGRFLRPRAPALFYGLVGVFTWTAWDAVAEGAWHSVVLPFTVGGLAGGFFDEIKDGVGKLKSRRGTPRPEKDAGSRTEEVRKSSFTYGGMGQREPPMTGRHRPEQSRQEPPKPPPAPEPTPPPRQPPAPEVPDHLRPALVALGLAAGRRPSPTEIKEAYRAFAKRFHPDRKGGDHADVSRFMEGTKALDALRAAGWA